MAHLSYFLRGCGGMRWHAVSAMCFYLWKAGEDAYVTHTPYLTYESTFCCRTVVGPTTAPPSPGSSFSFSDSWAKCVLIHDKELQLLQGRTYTPPKWEAVRPPQVPVPLVGSHLPLSSFTWTPSFFPNSLSLEVQVLAWDLEKQSYRNCLMSFHMSFYRSNPCFIYTHTHMYTHT